MRIHPERLPRAAAAIGIALLFASAAAWAQGAPTPGKPVAPALDRELIPGAEKMTPAERDEYRRRMQAAATPEERARLRQAYEEAANPGASSSSAPGALPGASSSSAPGALPGDPARGAQLHRACFFCHGAERYVSPVTYATASFIDSVLRASGLSDLPPSEPKRFKGRARSVADLRAGVNRRNELLNPKMTPQEVEDVVAYLNATYYRFAQP